jgi:hypothetical protein
MQGATQLNNYHFRNSGLHNQYIWKIINRFYLILAELRAFVSWWRKKCHKDTQTLLKLRLAKQDAKVHQEKQKIITPK